MTRVVVDGTALCYPLTGIGQYTRSLLDALAVARPEWEFVVMSPYAPLETVDRPNVSHDLVASRALSTRRVGWRAFWFDVILPGAAAALGGDVFWAATGQAPFLMRGLPVALTVHDFVPERYPETMARVARWYRKWNQRRWIRRASIVMPVSRAVASEAQAMFGVGATAIVSPGVDSIFAVPPDQESVESAPVGGDYVVVLGTLEPRKNIAALMRCVDVLCQERAWPDGLKVVIAGGRGWREGDLLSRIEPLERRGVVVRLGYVPRATLPVLLAGARALCMPSIYEGFGMPVAEAMAVGCPIVCSDIPPFREVIGGSAASYHAPNASAMLECYRAFVCNLPEPRSNTPVIRFTWNASAAAFAAAVESTTSVSRL
jgi:glycosyltransferase involved in cell wall biosynthesis